MDKKYLKYIFSLIGIVLFIIILSGVNLLELQRILLGINVGYLALTVLLNLIAIIFKTFKWKWVTNIISPDFSLKEAFISYMVGFSFSMFTPAKVGDLIKIFYVEKTGQDYGKAFSVVVVDRIIDIFLLFFMGITGIFAFSYLYNFEILPLWVLILLIILLISGTALIFSRRTLRFLLKPLHGRIIPKNWLEGAENLFNNYFEGVNTLVKNIGKLKYAIAAGLASWIMPFLYGYTMALSIGIELPIIFFVALIPIVCIIELLPISISGIGTRDLALIYLFGLQGISPESALAFSVLYLFICYWLVGLAGILIWLKYPIEIPERD